MRGSILAFAAAVVVLPWARALEQSRVVVDESKIRAVLRAGSTHIAVPFENNLASGVRASLSLSWVGSADQVIGSVQKDLTIQPGATTVELPLPISDPSLWLRLQYKLGPDRTEVRAFKPQTGTVALSQIADYVFGLNINNSDPPRRGSTFRVFAQAVHPATRAAPEGIEWSAVLNADGRELSPIRTKLHEGALVEFTFEIPAGSLNKNDDDEESEEVEIVVSGRSGDFEAEAKAEVPFDVRLSARLQTDKPIYQPGQTLHTRAVVLNPQGHAAAAAKVMLQIEDQNRQRVHTSHLVASRFGVVHDNWALPASAELGRYAVTITSDDGQDYPIMGHAVRVSRYELPTFKVETKADRTAYLPGQQPQITITGMYLFGKPVPMGKVKVTRYDPNHSGSKPPGPDDGDKTLVEGVAGEDGTFVTHLDLKEDYEEVRQYDSRRFVDVPLAAYYTDPISGRTEQRRFDVRLTREPIHVYFNRGHGGGAFPFPVYVSTYYADGRPAALARVELSCEEQTAEVRTNQYGLAKVSFQQTPDVEQAIVAHATDKDGLTGTWTEPLWQGETGSARLETSRTLHQARESVTLRLAVADAQKREPPADEFVLVHAMAGGRSVAQRAVRLVNGQGQVTFPYQAEFRRIVTFAFWRGRSSVEDPVADPGASRAVIFPDASDLYIEAAAERNTYRPGEKGMLHLRVRSTDGKPVEAAFGLAVVDQAVMERARTDGAFGGRSWFDCDWCSSQEDATLGGVRLIDLFARQQSPAISPDLDLVAEALVSAVQVSAPAQSATEHRPKFSKLEQQGNQIRSTLDEHYSESLEFPADASSLGSILGRQWSDMIDPWGMPYIPNFQINGNDNVIQLMSSGPDKRAGTADDFEVATYKRSYFAPRRILIKQILDRQADYPATTAELRHLLSENGILMDSLRDPWGTPYEAKVTTRASMREIALSSAGPDRKFGTKDDFSAASFFGPYFTREKAAISRAINGAPQRPPTLEEFRRVLSQAGIDVSSYLDAWGNPYRVTAVVSSRYNDRIDSKVAGVFGSAGTLRTLVTPVTEKLITFAIHSSGPDGLPNTYDDFNIAAFPVVLEQQSAGPDHQVVSGLTASPGNGTVTGVVTDPSGAAVPGAIVALVSSGGLAYEERANSDGVYRITVPAGIYLLRAYFTGFMSHETSQVPVTESETTTIDIQLQLGSITQTISVEAGPLLMQTMSAEMISVAAVHTGILASATAVSTPRVREYFPETLLWLPEVVTDAQGNAAAQFTLADSVTTWHIAAIASTLDGRVAETGSEMRSFQPLFLDFNPPLVLTEGDRLDMPVTVRNYESRERKLAVKIEPNDWSAVESATTVEATVPAGGAVNVNYKIQAKNAKEVANQKITAGSGRNGDAIQKTLRVHPDGQERITTKGDMIFGSTAFSVPIPAAAIRNALHGELRMYPNISSLLLESSSALLQTPHGCTEQTISAGYANLIALHYARVAGAATSAIEKTALANINLARDVLGMFDEDGGLPYWPSGDPDPGVTAYALHFLADAAEIVDDRFAATNEKLMPGLVAWLEKQQAGDGRWVRKEWDSTESTQQSLLLTSLVLRSLAAAQKAGIKVKPEVFAAGYHHIALSSDQTDEPYMIAQFILAALDSGDELLLGDAAKRLLALAREEHGGVYWDLRTNTPFYGWGTAGRVETTGLVVSALSAWSNRHGRPAEFDSAIRRGLVFLLRNRDSYGGWYSTQSTVRAMKALADASAVFGTSTGAAGAVEVHVNGHLVRTVSMPEDPRAIDPLLLDLSASLSPGENKVELAASAGSRPAMMLFASTYWLPWKETQPRSSGELQFKVQFDHVANDRSEAQVGEAVHCAVEAKRIGFHGYGMMLAEIGLPPGAEVDRASLETVLEGKSGVDHYDVLPDRVILYLWPKAEGSPFRFTMRARTPMVAKSAASILYDYYNPEIFTEVVPSRWAIH